MSALPDPDAVAFAVPDAWRLLTGPVDGAWSRAIGDVTVAVSNAPVGSLNVVLAPARETSTRDLEAGLEAVSRMAVPHCLQVRPAIGAAAGAVAERRGLVSQDPIPLMATGGRARAVAADELAIRRLEPHEAALHCELVAAAFGLSLAVFAALVTPAALANDWLAAYVGEVEGEAVTTALAVTAGDWVGIFDVATSDHMRRRGYGAAITAHAHNEAIDDGARWGWLQSSEAGLGVYRRLGFETLELWPTWVTPA